MNKSIILMILIVILIGIIMYYLCNKFIEGFGNYRYIDKEMKNITSLVIEGGEEYLIISNLVIKDSKGLPIQYKSSSPETVSSNGTGTYQNIISRYTNFLGYKPPLNNGEIGKTEFLNDNNSDTTYISGNIYARLTINFTTPVNISSIIIYTKFHNFRWRKPNHNTSYYPNMKDFIRGYSVGYSLKLYNGTNNLLNEKLDNEVIDGENDVFYSFKFNTDNFVKEAEAKYTLVETDSKTKVSAAEAKATAAENNKRAAEANATAAEAKTKAAEAKTKAAEAKATAAEAKTKAAEETKKAAELKTETAQKEAKTANDRAKAAEAKSIDAQQKAIVAEAKANSAQDKANTAQDRVNAAQDEIKVAQDKIKLAESKYEDCMKKSTKAIEDEKKSTVNTTSASSSTTQQENRTNNYGWNYFGFSSKIQNAGEGFISMNSSYSPINTLDTISSPAKYN